MVNNTILWSCTTSVLEGKPCLPFLLSWSWQTQNSDSSCLRSWGRWNLPRSVKSKWNYWVPKIRHWLNFLFCLWVFCPHICAWKCVCVPGACGGRRRVSDPRNWSYRYLWPTMWVWRIKLRSFQRADSTLNHWPCIQALIKDSSPKFLLLLIQFLELSLIYTLYIYSWY